MNREEKEGEFTWGRSLVGLFLGVFLKVKEERMSTMNFPSWGFDDGVVLMNSYQSLNLINIRFFLS